MYRRVVPAPDGSLKVTVRIAPVVDENCAVSLDVQIIVVVRVSASHCVIQTP